MMAGAVAGGSPPAYVGQVSGYVTSTGSGSPVDLTPLGLAEDDDLFVWITCDNNMLAGDGVTINGGVIGQGYDNTITTPTSSLPGYQLAHKRMGATPDTSVAITTHSAAKSQAYVIFAVRGANASALLDGTIATGTGGAVVADPPSQTTSAAGSLRVLLVGYDDSGFVDVTAPSGFTMIAVAGTNVTGGNGATAAAAYQENAAVGALNPSAFGGTTTGSAYVAHHLAIKGA